LDAAVEIPPKYGRDLAAGRSPEIGVWIDASMPFHGETIRRYVMALAATGLASPKVAERYLDPRQAAQMGGVANPVNIGIRLRYNQSFESIVAEVPNVVMLVLILIPAVLATIGVVREKENGSIANFYSTPITRFEFLFGKQLPYIAVSMISFVLLL